jgi:hypothetical protein
MAAMSPVKWRRNAGKFPVPNTYNGKKLGLALKQSAKVIILHEWLISWNTWFLQSKDWFSEVGNFQQTVWEEITRHTYFKCLNQQSEASKNYDLTLTQCSDKFRLIHRPAAT